MRKLLIIICLLCLYQNALMAGKETNDPDQLAALGVACLKKGDIAGAERYYLLGHRQKRITTSVISLAGDIALAKNDLQQADYYYGRAIYFDPRDTTGYCHYVRMHKQKEPELAVSKLQQLALYRRDCRVDHQIADVWYSANKVEKALNAYTAIPLDSLNRHELLNYAMSAYLLKEYAKSVEVVQRGISLYPRDFFYNRLLMYNYTELKAYDKALEASDKFFNHVDMPQASADDSSKGYSYLDYIYYGYVLNGCGRYEEGIAQFNRAQTIEGGDRPDVVLAISKAYEHIGQYAQAVTCYHTYMQKLTEEERTPFVIFELGRLYYAQGTDDRVTKELTPEKQNALQMAGQNFAEVARLRPDSYLGFYWQARANVALDPETTKGLAKPYYQRVIEMTQDKGGNQLTEAYKYLAYYYYVKNDKGNAQKYIDKILDINPMDKYALRLSSAI